MGTPKKGVSPAIIALMLFTVLVVPFLPLLISWRWDWWQAWVYAAICVLGFIASRALAARRHPDILSERASFMQKENTRSWDRILAPLVGAGGGLAPLVAGIEARLDGLGSFNLPVVLVALAVLLAGYALASYALIENRYFSGVVRLQTDRGHRVVTGGPYRWMRHPGYAGGFVSYLATPFLLDSFWAFLPTAIILVALVVRTALEDRFLQAELPGYRDYAARVRYRLIPGVW